MVLPVDSCSDGNRSGFVSDIQRYRVVVDSVSAVVDVFSVNYFFVVQYLNRDIGVRISLVPRIGAERNRYRFIFINFGRSYRNTADGKLVVFLNINSSLSAVVRTVRFGISARPVDSRRYRLRSCIIDSDGVGMAVTAIS